MTRNDTPMTERTKKKGRDNPAGLTAIEVIEDIAAFPLTMEFARDRYGEIENGSQAWGDGYAAWRNRAFAQRWLELNSGSGSSDRTT